MGTSHDDSRATMTAEGLRDQITIGVSIALPEPFGGELQRWRESFGDPQASAIPPHVTVVPPSVVGAGDVPAVEAHLVATAALQRPFTIQLRGTGTFRPVSPVVFVVLADGDADCARVEASVRAGPLARDLTFPYHPHVTVAHELAEPELDEALETLATYEARFTVDELWLYEQGPDGVWRSRRRFAFGR